MPKQKDLKRLVRSRMKKTGEAYTAARLQLVEKKNRRPTTPRLAGMSDAAVTRDRAHLGAMGPRARRAARRREASPRNRRLRFSLGTPAWWTQMVTVGYERIRGLRDKRQRRGGAYEASKSRTFPVPVDKPLRCVRQRAQRRRWLPAKIAVRSAKPPQTHAPHVEDDTVVELNFLSKGPAKSVVAVSTRSSATTRPLKR